VPVVAVACLKAEIVHPAYAETLKFTHWSVPRIGPMYSVRNEFGFQVQMPEKSFWHELALT